MDVRDKIAYWDKRQAVDNYGDQAHRYADGALLCPNDASHGALVITGSAALLICGARKGGAFCTGSRPVSV